MTDDSHTALSGSNKHDTRTKEQNDAKLSDYQN